MVKPFKNAYTIATELLYNKDRIYDLLFSSGYNNVIASTERVCSKIWRKINIRPADVAWTTALTVPCTTSEKGAQNYVQVN